MAKKNQPGKGSPRKRSLNRPPQSQSSEDARKRGMNQLYNLIGFSGRLSTFKSLMEASLQEVPQATSTRNDSEESTVQAQPVVRSTRYAVVKGEITAAKDERTATEAPALGASIVNSPCRMQEGEQLETSMTLEQEGSIPELRRLVQLVNELEQGAQQAQSHQVELTDPNLLGNLGSIELPAPVTTGTEIAKQDGLEEDGPQEEAGSLKLETEVPAILDGSHTGAQIVPLTDLPDTASLSMNDTSYAVDRSEILPDADLPPLLRQYGSICPRIVRSAPGDTWAIDASGVGLIMDHGVKGSVSHDTAIVVLSGTHCRAVAQPGAQIIVLARNATPAVEPIPFVPSLTFLPGSSLRFEQGSHFPGEVNQVDSASDNPEACWYQAHPDEDFDYLPHGSVAHLALHTGCEAETFRLNPGTLFEFGTVFPPQMHLVIPFAARLILPDGDFASLTTPCLAFANNGAMVECRKSCIVFHKPEAVVEIQEDDSSPPAAIEAEIIAADGTRTLLGPGAYVVSEILDRDQPQPPVTDPSIPFAVNPWVGVAIRVKPHGYLAGLSAQASEGKCKPVPLSQTVFQDETTIETEGARPYLSCALDVFTDMLDPEMVLSLTSDSIVHCPAAVDNAESLETAAAEPALSAIKDVAESGPEEEEAGDDDDLWQEARDPFAQKPSETASGDPDSDQSLVAADALPAPYPAGVAAAIVCGPDEVLITPDYLAGCDLAKAIPTGDKTAIFNEETVIPANKTIVVRGRFRVDDSGFSGKIRTVYGAFGEVVGRDRNSMERASKARIKLGYGDLIVNGVFDGSLEVSASVFPTTQLGVWECAGGGKSTTGPGSRYFGTVWFPPGSALPKRCTIQPGANIIWEATGEKLIAPPAAIVVACKDTTVEAGPLSIVFARDDSNVHRTDKSAIVFYTPQAKVSQDDELGFAGPQRLNHHVLKEFRFIAVKLNLDRRNVCNFEDRGDVDSSEMWEVDKIILPGEETLPLSKGESFICPQCTVVRLKARVDY